MNRIIIFSLVLVFTSFVACKNTANDPESIQKQISEYESQVIDLKSKITELEHQLDTMNTSKIIGKVLVGYKEAYPKQFINYIDVVGNVTSDLQSLISPETNGIIDKIYVKEGDYVKKGALLASLKTEITESSINEVETSLNLAKTVYQKQKELWDQKIGSELQYLQAKNNKESLEMRLKTLKVQKDMAQITAPYDGYVETIFQKEGEIASPGRQVIQLINISEVKVQVDVSEAYISNIHDGDIASITFPSFPDMLIKEPVTMTGYIINPNNRTFKVQVNIPNRDLKLKPNLISNVQLIQQIYDSVIVVPSIIVKNDAKGQKYLYVVSERNGNMISEKRYIQTGVSYGNNTLVINGLKSGDRYIDQGYNIVKNGSEIRLK